MGNKNSNLPEQQEANTPQQGDPSVMMFRRTLQEEEEEQNNNNEVALPTHTMQCSEFVTLDFFTTDLQVLYQVETTVPIEEDFDTSLLAQKLPLLVQGAAVETIHETLCAKVLDPSTGRKRADDLRLAKCLYSITTAEHSEMTYCDDNTDTTTTGTETEEAPPNCVAFTGDLKLFHGQDCHGDMELAAIMALIQGAQDDDALVESINARLTRLDNQVTRVVATDHKLHKSVESAAMVEGKRKISPGGYVVIFLAGLLLLLLFALLFRQRRQRQRGGALRSGKEEDQSVLTDDSHPEDEEDVSYLTSDISNRASPFSQSEDDIYQKPDFDSLCMGRQQQQKAAGTTHQQQQAEEDEECEQGIEAIAHEEVPVSIGFLRTPRRFKIFRKKRPAVTLESCSFVRTSSAQTASKDPEAASEGLSVAL